MDEGCQSWLLIAATKIVHVKLSTIWRQLQLQSTWKRYISFELIGWVLINNNVDCEIMVIHVLPDSFIKMSTAVNGKKPSIKISATSSCHRFTSVISKFNFDGHNPYKFLQIAYSE